MTQELKEIYSKPSAEWTEDEQKVVNEAIEKFKEDITEVCRKHEMAYESVLQITENGIKPTLRIVKVSFEDKK